MALLGIGLLAIGSIGVFFGRMIQSSISRQRELLADASAVQFTRDTDGLVGALKKIGGAPLRTFIPPARPKADEASHIFFSEAIRRLRLFAGLCSGRIRHSPNAFASSSLSGMESSPRWPFRTSPMG